MAKRRGVSLLELLVVLAVVGGLAAIAPLILPTDRFAVSQAAERFEADMRRARFEAVRTNQVVVFTADATGHRAVGADRRELINVPLEGTGLQMAVEPVLRIRFDPRGVSYFLDGSATPIVPGTLVSVTIRHTRGAESGFEINSYGRLRRV